MLELLTGATLSIISLLIGYSLGKNQTVVSNDVRKQIKQIFTRVVPDREVGPIPRPTQQMNYYRDNPKAAKEDEIMQDEFDTLNDVSGVPR